MAAESNNYVGPVGIESSGGKQESSLDENIFPVLQNVIDDVVMMCILKLHVLLGLFQFHHLGLSGNALFSPGSGDLFSC